MTTTTEREALHRLADELTDADVPVALRVLEALRLAQDPVLRSLRCTPLDDEPDEDDVDGGLTEARQQLARGEH